jgi:hypothetical protein
VCSTKYNSRLENRRRHPEHPDAAVANAIIDL